MVLEDVVVGLKALIERLENKSYDFEGNYNDSRRFVDDLNDIRTMLIDSEAQIVFDKYATPIKIYAELFNDHTRFLDHTEFREDNYSLISKFKNALEVLIKKLGDQ